jgi:hypothetical protein
MIGDVVGGAHKIVKGADNAAMARGDKPRGNRKIFVLMAFSRSQFGGAFHRSSETFAWMRPFQLPPRPRTC